MAGKEEWQRLADIIQHWNNTRLDLFEISLPCKVSGLQKYNQSNLRWSRKLLTPLIKMGKND
uniref:Uncharacterized protein n=1 Tax=Hucho hucho TaxID=62062 RepID=A0A4W5P889_9TELE